jgi:hypothetical protein
MRIIGPNENKVKLFVYQWNTRKRLYLKPADGEFHSFHWQEVGGSYKIGKKTDQLALDLGIPDPMVPEADVLPSDYHWLTNTLLSRQPLAGFVKVDEHFRPHANRGTVSHLRRARQENPSR